MKTKHKNSDKTKYYITCANPVGSLKLLDFLSRVLSKSTQLYQIKRYLGAFER